MVKINKIYTRSGDQGTTGLVGGTRIEKDSLRVAAYGDVDELNSFIGLTRTLATEKSVSKISEMLGGIQNELFDMGALLASPPSQDKNPKTAIPQLSEHQIKRLENWIDELIDGLPELKSFVLPGGEVLNANLHICRTVCRRTERSVLALSRKESVDANCLIYLNRLSDLLFAMSRYASAQLGIAEYLWQPSKLIK